MPVSTMNQACVSGITVQDAERWDSLDKEQRNTRSGTFQDSLKRYGAPPG